MATSDAIHGVASGGASQPKALHIGLWVAQAMLAVAFGMAGLMKATQPIADLAQQMQWPGEVPAALVRFIGVSELLGAIGLIVPAAARVKPMLTPLAALGLATVMLFAAVFHASRGEFSGIVVNIILGALAMFIAWGRSKRAPIAAR